MNKALTRGSEIATAPGEPVPILTDPEIIALLKSYTVGRGRPRTFTRPIILGQRDEVILRFLSDIAVRVSELMPTDRRSDEMLSRYAATTAVERAHEAHRRAALGDQLEGRRPRLRPRPGQTQHVRGHQCVNPKVSILSLPPACGFSVSTIRGRVPGPMDRSRILRIPTHG